MTRSLRRWGIRSRLLLAAAIPVTLVTLVLGGYSTWSRLQDSHRYLLALGRTQVTHLAATAGFPLYGGDWPALQGKLEQIVGAPEVQMAAILDAERRLVAWAGDAPEHLQLPPEILNGIVLAAAPSTLMFSLPVRAAALEAEPEPEPEPLREASDDRASTPVLGWVYLGLDRSALAAQERTILSTSLGVGLLVLSLSILLALAISSSVAAPMRRLTETLVRLRAGELDARVAETSGGELGTLETGFNRMAETIADSQRSLVNQVTRATAELQETLEVLESRNRELQEAHRQALAADQAKTEFLALMSHELRTPINAVIGFTDLMQKSTDPVERIEFADTAHRAAGSLLAVIDGILAFSKLDQGRVELEQVPFDLVRMVEDVVAMFAPGAQDRGLELVLLVDSDLPKRVRGDPKALAEIVMNLLSNAVKFTDEGEVTVRLALANPDRVELNVADSGIGVDDEAKQRLFNPFVQADTSIRRRFGGTGLGLVICERLVELAGGDIKVEDNYPRGTRFRIRLPLSAVPVPPAEREAMPLVGRKTLLYDAHPRSRRALRNQLLGMGASLFQVRDTDRMLSLLAGREGTDGRFDLLVLGLARRELIHSGLSAILKRVRTRFQGPILVLASAAPGYAPARVARQPGVICRSKPIRRELLRQSLGELLGQPAALEPAPTRSEPVRFPGCRVLVAEDHQFNQALMQNMLAPLGCELVLAENGRRALELAFEQRFDLILMDLHMPDQDGFATATAIRAGEGPNRYTPIVAVTADLSAKDVIERSGIDDWLFKPVSQEQLAYLLRRWVGERGRSADAGTSVVKAPLRLRQQVLPELFELVERLGEALALGDLVLFREQTHQLAGLCGYFEFNTLEVASRRLDRLAREGESRQELRAGLERVALLLREAQEHAPEPEVEPADDGAGSG